MSDQLTPYPVTQQWVAGATRQLTIPVSTARTVLLQVIRGLGFATRTEQFTLIEAGRGYKLRGLTLTRTRVPVHLRVTIDADEPGCRLGIRVEDRWAGPTRPAAAVAVYADVFTEVLAAIDEQLKYADPEAAESFPTWWRNLPENEIHAGSHAAGVAERLESAVSRRSARVLDGPRRGPTAAVSSSGAAEVTFVVSKVATDVRPELDPDAASGSAPHPAAPTVIAQIAADIVDGMLTSGQLVVASPGAMPPTLVAQVQAMVVLLEHRIAAISQAGRYADLTVEIAAADRPVISFLYQQTALREKLPVRVLLTCTTCRLEKIVNPDFLKLRERNRRVRILQTSVGAALGSHTISPFLLVGRLAQIKKTDPDFVCQRCQGTDADEKPITFCPRCGDRRADSVLRSCSKCDLDLRTLLETRQVWHEVAGQPEPADDVVPADRPSGALEPGQSIGPTPVAAHPSSTYPPPVQPLSQPGWYPDPWRRFEVRYHDGRDWTMHVASFGRAAIDVGDR